MPGRPRTKFSAAQLQELERSFREQRYIGASEKRRLAALLNLSQSQVSAAPRGPGPGPGRPVKRPLGMASERITQQKTRRLNLFLTLSFLSPDKNLVSESPDEV